MATSDTIPEPNTDLEQISDVAAELRRTFDGGATRSIEWRDRQLAALGRLVSENADAFVAALQADLGKPTLEALTADLVMVTDSAKAARKSLKKWMAPRRVSTPLQSQPAKSWLQSEPLGVALIISPWNYPVQLLMLPVIGAVAAGNCVVMKPSEVTPHVSALVAELVPRYLDSKCFRVIEGGVAETTALLEQRFDHIFYTGNGAVGRIVMEAAARHLTPVTLELGGKSPCIVDKSANLEVAAKRIAWGKWMNAGQTCIAPDYVLVHEDVEAELVDKLANCVRAFYGEDPRESGDYARIVNSRHIKRLQSLLKESGDVVVGGEVNEDERYFAPTILRNVPPESPVMSDEIFGPILPVLRVRDVDEAIAFVTSRDKPLALYAFTESQEIEAKILERTSSGGAAINATIFQASNPNLPFGGVGPSGTGSYHGKASFDTFSHQKSVLRKPTRFDLKFLYPPYRPAMAKMIRKSLG